jgi:hypothetical protein
MDKLIPEKAQGKEFVQFISYPVEIQIIYTNNNTNTIEIQIISILTHATIVR